jgi:Tol biopolymer transport system component
VYPNAAIYIVNADGSNLQPWITLLGGAFDPDWTDPGIAFTHLDGNKPRIWLAGADGSEPRQISQPNAVDSQPSWAPDGEHIALINTSRTGSATIYWIRSDGSFDGSNPDQITRDLVVSSPDWSPDGRHIAYETDGQIWVIEWDALGYGAVQLTVLAPNKDPDWSPDGQWLTFESWREAANHDIYIMTENGGQQTRLTTDPALDYQPAWRP